MHMLRHRRGHGDGLQGNSRRRRRRCGAGDSLNQEVLAAKRTVCRGTRSQGSPSDSNGRQP